MQGGDRSVPSTGTPGRAHRCYRTPDRDDIPEDWRGITEGDHMTRGYGLLRQFKTVWDFPQGRIVLLES